MASAAARASPCPTCRSGPAVAVGAQQDGVAVARTVCRKRRAADGGVPPIRTVPDRPRPPTRSGDRGRPRAAPTSRRRSSETAMPWPAISYSRSGRSGWVRSACASLCACGIVIEPRRAAVLACASRRRARSRRSAARGRPGAAQSSGRGGSTDGAGTTRSARSAAAAGWAAAPTSDRDPRSGTGCSARCRRRRDPPRGRRRPRERETPLVGAPALATWCRCRRSRTTRRSNVPTYTRSGARGSTATHIAPTSVRTRSAALATPWSSSKRTTSVPVVA